jgi:hypothetical protein
MSGEFNDATRCPVPILEAGAESQIKAKAQINDWQI